MSKTLKHIAAFDYVDTALLVSSATSGGVSIASLSTVADANTYWNQSWIPPPHFYKKILIFNFSKSLTTLL